MMMMMMKKMFTDAVQVALDAALGPGWGESMSIDDTPIGSGCIAQVSGWAPHHAKHDYKSMFNLWCF